MKKLTIATNNDNKVREIKQILGDFYDEIVSQEEDGILIEVEEDGTTFHKNASLKAIEISNMVEGDVLADDSGLCVDALNGAPGIHSSRFSDEGTDEANNQKLLNLLKDKPVRTARFVCAIVLANGGEEQIYVEDYTKGIILGAPRGSEGFGYDPLFLNEESGKTFAELSAEEKNEISHRAKALRKLKKRVSERWEEKRGE